MTAPATPPGGRSRPPPRRGRRRPAIEFLVANREVHASLPGLLLWSGFPSALVPYDRVAREEGRSRWTFAKKVKYFIDSIVSFSYAPLRGMSVAGAILALLAFGY